MRALTEFERRNRQDALAQVALSLFRDLGYAKLTMEAVARAAGVAKGTVFLAFATKEDLFLHVARLQFEAWMERLGALDPSQATPRTLAEATLSTLRTDPSLLSLMALVGPVLERGCTAEAVIAFKESLGRSMTKLANLWCHLMPSVDRTDWIPLFLRIHALTLGAWAVGDVSDTVRAALAGRPDLSGLLVSFEDLYLSMLEVQLAVLYE